VSQPGAKPNDNIDDAAIQAIDSGASTIYFPTGAYIIMQDYSLRGNLRKIVGMEALFIRFLLPRLPCGTNREQLGLDRGTPECEWLIEHASPKR